MDIKTLGKKLAVLRKAKGLTQKDVALKLKTKSKSAISMWENGVNEPGATAFLQLLSLYGVTEAGAITKMFLCDELPKDKLQEHRKLILATVAGAQALSMFNPNAVFAFDGEQVTASDAAEVLREHANTLLTECITIHFTIKVPNENN